MKMLTATEVREVLEAVEKSDVTIAPIGQTADAVYAGNVTYKASNGWTLVVFNDCNCWDYLDSVVTPDGRRREYPDGFDPSSYDAVDELFLSYRPSADVARDVYGFTR